MSKAIYYEDSFVDNCPKADFYVTGSDQVWNYKHNEGIDSHYFFEGIEGVKIAYSSSIGMDQIPNDYYRYMKEKLTEYRAVSVREEFAVKLLEEMGINAVQVLDPTLMLTINEWKMFSSKQLVKDRYLFLYLPYNIVDKDLIYRSAKKIADKKNLKIVSYSENVVRDKYADKTVFFVNAGDVLSLFYYADIIVTNSFHGTAFSINLNKQFWVYNPSHFVNRITSILNLCNLRERLLGGEIPIDKIDEEINYSYANLVLQRERKVALDYLTKALQ